MIGTDVKLQIFTNDVWIDIKPPVDLNKQLRINYLLNHITFDEWQWIGCE